VFAKKAHRLDLYAVYPHNPFEKEETVSVRTTFSGERLTDLKGSVGGKR
jgi:hypothetical protein